MLRAIPHPIDEVDHSGVRATPARKSCDSGFRPILEDELFSLTPADFLCYSYGMPQDVTYSPASPERARREIAARQTSAALGYEQKSLGAGVTPSDNGCHSTVP